MSPILNLGTLTLPQGLAWIVLAEQLYRAATILAGILIIAVEQGADLGAKAKRIAMPRARRPLPPPACYGLLRSMF